MDFYEDFKPVRNYLRKLNIFDTLLVLRRYVDSFNKKNSNRFFLDGIEKSNQNIIMPNQLDFLISNSIIYCTDIRSEVNIAKSNDRGRLLLHVKKLEDTFNQKWTNSDIWLWLHAFGLNQQKMFEGDVITKIYRYKAIYEYGKIAEKVNQSIGLSYLDFAGCGLWLFACFSRPEGFCIPKSYFENIDSKYDSTPYSRKNVMITLSILSIPLLEIREKTKSILSYGLETFYPLNAPYNFQPIIEYEHHYYCVFPVYILNQITNGVYYLSDIPNAKLNNDFGKSFEEYVGYIIGKSINEMNYTIRPEIKYGKSDKKSSDWIIANDTELIFIECKTKRIRQKSHLKESLKDELLEDMNEYAKGITQLYKVYNDYTKNLIPNLLFDEKNFFYPIMITLEEWFPKLPTIDEYLIKRVKSNLTDIGIDSNIVDTNTFQIFCMEKFEQEVQIMMKEGFGKYKSGTTKSGEKIDDIYRKNFSYIRFFDDQMHEDFIAKYQSLVIE